MKSKYLKFCEDNAEVSVFAQPWYLDIVTGANWDVVLSYDKEEKIVGAWPYHFSKRKGFSFIQMPPYTPSLGPIINFPDHLNSPYKTNSFYFSQLRELAAQLPNAGYININFPIDGQSWYPLYELGYKQTTRYSYIIDHKLGLDKITSNLKPKLRNVVLKEVGEFEIRTNEKLEEFVRMLGDTLAGNNAGQFFYPTNINELITVAINKGVGKVLGYYNQQGEMIAGIFIIEDVKKTYCLFTAKNEEGKKEEAVSKLIWEGIKESVEKGKDFDFEGSMLPGVEKFFRTFGGEQVAYHQISKISNPIMRWYKYIKP
ncbi:hypothetical protein [Portibacter lacus]|uniref:BioF2-like acetyltransferase domain-containing protein n=1 Tax=Portibacter lacus TaxID=1099794 RepID=A0AA37SRJ5_9BACT|nr:hypothetical protein [Portibacter lacus]GLR18887.1 hypothetical protein GCM10007940_35030 [Portibacter lacus]